MVRLGRYEGLRASPDERRGQRLVIVVGGFDRVVCGSRALVVPEVRAGEVDDEQENGGGG